MPTAGAGCAKTMRVSGGGTARAEEAGVGAGAGGDGGVSEIAGDAQRSCGMDREICNVEVARAAEGLSRGDWGGRSEARMRMRCWVRERGMSGNGGAKMETLHLSTRRKALLDEGSPWQATFEEIMAGSGKFGAAGRIDLWRPSRCAARSIDYIAAVAGAADDQSDADGDASRRIRRRFRRIRRIEGGSAGSTASLGGEHALDVLGFGLGLSPLISGLVSLFGGGGGSSQAAPLVPYVAPPSVNATAGISASQAGAFGVDTADGGLPRPQPASASSATQITVQVQAMDSQSFLDHSDDIAQAVRQAMLESSTLNDVIRAV